MSYLNDEIMTELHGDARRTVIVEDQFVSIPISEFESFVILTYEERLTILDFARKALSRSMLRQSEYELSKRGDGLYAQTMTAYDKEVLYLQHIVEKIERSLH